MTTPNMGLAQIALTEDIKLNTIPEIANNFQIIDDKFGNLSDKVNIRNFGAKGDGVTDDSQALINCIAYAKANNIPGCRVPIGNYLINTSSKILIDFDSFVFYGDGQNVSTLRFNNATGGLLFQKPANGIIYQCQFKNICVTGNGVTNDLISIPNHMEELRVNNAILTNTVNSIILGGEIDTSWIKDSDISNSQIGVNLTNAGNLFLSDINFFNLTKAFNVDGNVNSINVRDSYFEECNYILLGTANCTALSVLKLNNVTYLKNSGNNSPFYFTSEVALDQITLNEVKHVIGMSIPAIFEFNTKQNTKSVYIKLLENKFEQTVNGYLTYLMKTTVDTVQSKMYMFVFDCNLGALNNFNALVNGQAYVSVLDASSIYVQTNDRGIKVNSTDPYAGRITFNNSTKRLGVTNSSDVTTPLPLTLAAATTDRASLNLQVGEWYWDVTVNKPIWYKGNGLYVDATGASA